MKKENELVVIETEERVIKPEPKVEKASEFKGYTLHELRHQRSLVELKKELSKVRMMESYNRLRGHGPQNDSGSRYKKLTVAGKIASVVFSRLNTLDYVMMGMSLFGTVRKGVKLLKGRK
ncbi:MAG: hypothetical protein K2M87_06655 [Muribaculaceae bacterium]|nr:hypothetical protein [Muribaculaceae bacterium]